MLRMILVCLQRMNSDGPSVVPQQVEPLITLRGMSANKLVSDYHEKDAHTVAPDGCRTGALVPRASAFWE